MKANLFLIIGVIAVLLALPISNAKEEFLSSDYIKTYISKNYPVIPKNNINIKILDIKISWWNAWFEAPNIIIIARQDIKTDKDLDWLLNHELNHFYCYKLYKKIDEKHKDKRCFIMGESKYNFKNITFIK